MGPDKKKIEALENRMKQLGIKKEDIQERFIKASGRGGQKVNKTNCAVFLKHEKTRLSVKCSTSRSQHLNRFLALRSLVDKIEACLLGRSTGVDKKTEQIRKQKKRRKRKTRAKLSNGSD